MVAEAAQVAGFGQDGERQDRADARNQVGVVSEMELGARCSS